jgi:tetratricopeptide (TPR) repeat protein
LAPHFVDGCLFLDLRGYAPDAPEVTAGEALHRFLRLLGVPGESIPGHLDDRAGLYRDRLRGKRILIVLDNARSAGQVVPLLPAEPQCGVLVTSRSRLAALDDAHHVSLGTLSEPEAIQLFRSVAGARVSDSTFTEKLIGRIVQRCGRLPLAIRIAAARYRGNPAWTVAGLDRRLADEEARLDELDDGERSVSAAFHLSYRELPPDQQRMFALLALHQGPDINAHSAAALAGTGVRQAERLLDRLHDAHLVIQQAHGRYRFHDLVRAFARDTAVPHLADTDQDAAVRRLLDYSLHGAEAADTLLTPYRYRPEFDLPAGPTEFQDRGEAMSWVEAEWPNLVALCRMAAVRKVYTRCWQLAYTLRGFFFLAKLWDPWVETHTLAIESARAVGDQRAEAMTLNNLGIAHIDRGDQELAASCFRDALVLFSAVGDNYGTANCLVNLAWVHHYRGDHPAALRDMWRALDFYRKEGEDRNAAITLRGIAVMQVELGAISHAIQHATQSVAVFHELGMPLDAAMALNCLAKAYFRQGNHTRAAASHRQAIALSEECGSRYEAARAESGLGHIAAAAGRLEEAQEHWDRAVERYPELAHSEYFGR